MESITIGFRLESKSCGEPLPSFGHPAAQRPVTPEPPGKPKRELNVAAIDRPAKRGPRVAGLLALALNLGALTALLGTLDLGLVSATIPAMVLLGPLAVA